MKTTSKLLCLILAIMVMLPMIASCDLFGKKDETPDNGGSSDGNGSGQVRDEVYNMTGLEDKTFDGEQFVVGYSMGGKTITEWIPKPINPKTDDIATSKVAEASYKRDQKFEALTGARLIYNGYGTNPNTDGDDSESKKFVDLHTGGMLKDYDLLMFGGSTLGKLAQEKVLMDLNEYDNLIHHDQIYYTSTLNQQLSVGGKQLATAGYYTTGNIRGTQVTCVNNTALTDQHGTDLKQELYNLALNKEWTFEKLFTYDGDFATGTVYNNENDKYTLVISEFGCENLFYALGGTTIGKNSQDLPYVTVNSAENQARLAAIRDKTSSKYVHIPAASGSAAEFNRGQALFQIGMIGAYGAARQLLNVEECLLPVPMEKAGGEYKSFLPTWNSNVSGIPAQTANPENAAYFYELYMALSYNYIYPAYYENTMKTNYAQNETEAKIFDIVAKSICLETAGLYNWINDKNTDIRQIVNNNFEVISTVTTLADSLDIKIDEFLAKYEIN